MRKTGEHVKRYAGDTDAAQQYLGLARVLLGRMKAYLAGAYGSKAWRQPDGAIIETKSLPSGDVIRIVAPPVPVVPVGHPHGFLFEPVDTEEQRFLYTTSDWFFRPHFRIRKDTALESGTIQWLGRRHFNLPTDDMLFFRGPQSGYFIWKTYPPAAAPLDPDNIELGQTIWQHDNTTVGGPSGYVCGVARYRDEDGAAIICAHTDGYVIRFSRKNPGFGWTQIGSHTISPEGTYVDYLSTICPFSKDGKKATFVTGMGGNYEVSFTFEVATVTELVAPMERRAYYEYETSFVNETLGTSGVLETVENTYSLDDSSVGIMSRTPGGLFSDGPLTTYDHILAADYNDQDELITAFARVSNGGYFLGAVAVTADYTPLFLTKDVTGLSVTVPTSPTGPYHSFETLTGNTFTNDLAFASVDRDVTASADGSVIAPLEGGKVELMFSDEDAEPVLLAELTEHSYSVSLGETIDWNTVPDPDPPNHHNYTEGVATQTGSVTASFKWMYRAIRFLDLKSCSAVLSGTRQEIAASASGTLNFEWEHGTRPPVFDPVVAEANGTIIIDYTVTGSGSATDAIFADDVIYKNGAVETTRTVQIRQHTQNLVDPISVPSLPSVFITGDASERQSSTAIGRTGFAHVFAMDPANAARIKLRKHNFLFSGLALGGQLGTDPLNLLYLDGQFREPIDMVESDGLFLNIKVI